MMLLGNNKFRIRTYCQEETEEIAERLARYFYPGTIICLIGKLGSGKTTFVRGFCHSFRNSVIVRSPSFKILNIYENKKYKIYHYDFYRINYEEEIYTLGGKELFFQDDGVCIIEWADKIKKFLPKEFLEVRLKFINMNTRELILLPYGEKYKKILEKFYKSFKKAAN